MFIKSIRWRLQLWQAFLLLVALTGFGVTAYQLHRTNRLGQIDAELERRVVALGTDIHGRPPFGPPPMGRPPGDQDRNGPPPVGPDRDGPRPWDLLQDGPPPRPGLDPRGPHAGPGGAMDPRETRISTGTMSLFEPAETNGFYFAIWSRSGTLLKASTNAPPGITRPLRSPATMGLRSRLRDTCREVYQFTEFGECLIAGRNIAADLRAQRRFAGWLVVAGSAVLALGLGGGWLLASRAIRPVEVISTAASRISAGNLAERINLGDTENELGRLAGVLNSTFARLEAAFAQQKQFTADASHELRTPLAVIISETQSALARERTTAEYRETIEACLDAAQQMRRQTQALLQLARFDAGQESLERTSFDLAERTRACADLIRPLAEERGLHLTCDLSPAPVTGDPDRLDQVITNLLTNAIWHNSNQGSIHLSTRLEPGAALLSVVDAGPGIPPENLPRIFERFYRGDQARARTEGRSGLGLAISKAIIDLHGGRIDVSSEPGRGTTFTVRLPT